MFWNQLIKLCNMRNTTPNGVCEAIGLSSAIATKWKNGSTPRDTTLKKIADYFGVSVEYFKEDSAEPSDRSPAEQKIFKKMKQMTPEQLAKFEEFADLIINQKK